MWNSKHLLMGTGAGLMTLALVSFSGGDDTPKKKKYHIIHQKDGVLTEYDTLLPMDSEYSVEDFLSSKGISSTDAKIIEIPGIPSMKGMDNKEQRVIVRHFDEDVVFDEADGEHVEVQIFREVSDDGKEVIRKTINGEEVSLTEEEKAAIRNGQAHVVWVEKSDQPRGKGDQSEEVELNVHVDENGKVSATKRVNGKEVDLTPEELEEIRLHQLESDGQHRIFIEGDMEGSTEDMEVEFIGEDSEGTPHILVKEVVMEQHTSGDASGEMRKEVRVMSRIDGGDEDFTVVLVSNDLDESAEIHTSSRMDHTALNEPISVYPNPNSGTFTIAFNQNEKVQTRVEITDLNGKTVFKEKLGVFSGSYKKEVNLRQYGSGTYLVTVYQGDEVSALKVMVE